MNDLPDMIQIDESFLLTLKLNPSGPSLKIHQNDTESVTFSSVINPFSDTIKAKLFQIFLSIFHEYTIHLKSPCVELNEGLADTILKSFSRYFNFYMEGNMLTIHLEELVQGLFSFYEDTGMILFKLFLFPRIKGTDTPLNMDFSVTTSSIHVFAPVRSDLRQESFSGRNSFNIFSRIFNSNSKIELLIVNSSSEARSTSKMFTHKDQYLMLNGALEFKLFKYLAEYFPDTFVITNKELIATRKALDEFIQGIIREKVKSTSVGPTSFLGLRGSIRGISTGSSYNNFYRSCQPFDYKFDSNNQPIPLGSTYFPKAVGRDKSRVIIRKGYAGYAGALDVNRIFAPDFYLVSTDKSYDNYCETLSNDPQIELLKHERFESFNDIPFANTTDKRMVALSISHYPINGLNLHSQRNRLDTTPSKTKILEYFNSLVRLPEVQSDTLIKEAFLYLIALAEASDQDFMYIHNHSSEVRHPAWTDQPMQYLGYYADPFFHKMVGRYNVDSYQYNTIRSAIDAHRRLFNWTENA